MKIPPLEIYCDLLDDLGPGRECGLPFGHDGSCEPIATGCASSPWCMTGPDHDGPCVLAAAHHAQDDSGMVLSFPRQGDGRRAIQRASALWCAEVLEQHGAQGQQGAAILRVVAARLEMGFPASPPVFRDARDSRPQIIEDDHTDRLMVPPAMADYEDRFS